MSAQPASLAATATTAPFFPWDPVYHDPRDRRDNVLGAIVRVILASKNTPLGPRQIAAEIRRLRLHSLGGLTPYATVSSRISQHFSRVAAARGRWRPVLDKVADEDGRHRWLYRVVMPDELMQREKSASSMAATRTKPASIAPPRASHPTMALRQRPLVAPTLPTDMPTPEEYARAERMVELLKSYRTRDSAVSLSSSVASSAMSSSSSQSSTLSSAASERRSSPPSVIVHECNWTLPCRSLPSPEPIDLSLPRKRPDFLPVSDMGFSHRNPMAMLTSMPRDYPLTDNSSLLPTPILGDDAAFDADQPTDCDSIEVWGDGGHVDFWSSALDHVGAPSAPHSSPWESYQATPDLQQLNSPLAHGVDDMESLGSADGDWSHLLHYPTDSDSASDISRCQAVAAPIAVTSFKRKGSVPDQGEDPSVSASAMAKRRKFRSNRDPLILHPSSASFHNM